jgi:hypothetical protein
VYSNDVKKVGFSELEPLQFARIRTGTTTKQDAEALAEQIVNQFPELGELTANDPMRDWIDRITFRLGKVESKEKLLDAARALHVRGEDIAQVRLPEGPRFLAHQLLGPEPDRPTDEVGRRTYKAIFEHGPRPTEVNTDRAPAYPRVIEELIPAACHVTEQYATDEIVNPATFCEVGVCLEPFLSSGGSGLRRWSGAGVKVERPAGRTTLTPARTGVASGGGRRGWTSSRRAG